MEAVIERAMEAMRARRNREQRAARLKLRRELREGRERLKSRRDHEAEAQRAFNAYIRERDFADSCICCDGWPRTPSNHQWDAGHYRSTGAAPDLRFDEDNCHKQLVSCNRNKSGNTVEYRIRLIAKIGPEAVERLEGPHPPKKYTVDELKAIRKLYQVKLRELRQAREMGHEVAA